MLPKVTCRRRAVVGGAIIVPLCCQRDARADKNAVTDKVRRAQVDPRRATYILT